METCYNKTDYFLISLQPFQITKSTENIVVLYDRIGLYHYNSKNGDVTIGKIECQMGEEIFTVSDALFKMEITDLELPLDDDKLEVLVKEIKSRVN